MKKLIFTAIFFLSTVGLGAMEFTNLTVTAIDIRNNKEIPFEVLENNMELKQDSVYTSSTMVQDYIKLKKLPYIKDLKIYPEIYNKGIKLNVYINEEENVKELLSADEIIPLSDREKIDKSLIVKAVSVSGNKNITSETILENVPINVGSYFSKTKTVEGKNAIMETGYFKDVAPNILKYKDGIYIKYNVIENPKIEDIKIYGNELISTEKLLDGIKTEIGVVYNLKTLKEDADLILKKYHDKGYVMANIIDIAMDENLVLNIQISEGIVRKIMFEKMIVDEDAETVKASKEKLKTRGYILKREVEVEVGKPFELEKFQQTVKNLFRLGFFKSVNQEFRRIPGDPNGIELVILLDENKSASMQGAISYGSAVGVVGTVSVNDNNFRGKGQTLGLSAEISSENRKLYEINFSDPWIKDTERLSLSTGIYKKIVEDSDGSETDRLGGRISLGKGFGRNYRVRLGLNLEKVKEYTRNGDVDKLSDYGGDYNIIKLGPSFYYDTRDNILNATDGDYGRLTIEYGKVFDGKSYYATELEGRKYHRFLFDKNTMAYRGILGATSDNTPSSQLYEVGGGNSLRGYESGEFDEGYVKFFVNVENRIKIEDNFQFVMFYDIGRSWENSDMFFDAEDLKQNYGIGLRVETPLGPLRLDYGWPIGDNQKSGGEFHFNIGQMF